MAENDTEKVTEFQKILLKERIGIYERINISVKQLVDDLSVYNKPIIDEIYNTALSMEKKELANKIEKADNIIVLGDVNTFLKVIRRSKKNDFSEDLLEYLLEEMNYDYKTFLQDAIKYTIPKVKNRALTKEEKTAISILETSKEKEIAKIGEEHTEDVPESLRDWRKLINKEIFKTAFQDNPDHEKTR